MLTRKSSAVKEKFTFEVVIEVAVKILNPERTEAAVKNSKSWNEMKFQFKMKRWVKLTHQFQWKCWVEDLVDIKAIKEVELPVAVKRRWWRELGVNLEVEFLKELSTSLCILKENNISAESSKLCVKVKTEGAETSAEADALKTVKVCNVSSWNVSWIIKSTSVDINLKHRICLLATTSVIFDHCLSVD